MADISPAFLDHLKSLYPQSAEDGPGNVVDNPWYIVAAMAFTSCNRPEVVPLVFKYVHTELLQAQKRYSQDETKAYQEQLRLARRVRETLLKGALLCGAPRVRSLLRRKMGRQLT